MKKELINLLKIAILAVVLSVGIGYVLAWTGPTATPPSSNVSAPINVSSASQTKSGSLWANGFFSSSGGYFAGVVGIATTSPAVGVSLSVNGKVGATQYCDQNGGNCSSSAGGIPSGAVMAFDLSSCPSGWSQFTQASGRVVIGTGDSGTNGSTNHTLLQQGGEEKHTLTVAQLPQFRLSIPWSAQNTGGSTGQQPDPLVSGGATYTNYIGSNQAHNVLDPYVALLYCVKN